MDTSRNDLLGELAADASLEHSDYLTTAAAQLDKFLDANCDRIAELGGLVLIDDEVDYLAVTADGTFQSRTRYQDEATGKWRSETETIETAAELVELYNLADVFAAFAEAAKTDAGMPEEPTGTQDLLETANVAPEDTISLEENPYAGAADEWAAGQDFETAPESEEEAAERLYDLALAFQERSQQTEADLLEQFERAASVLTAVLGDLVVVDDEDERLTLKATGSFRAEVVPEDQAETGEWRKLDSPDDIVEFYDPTDIFGDLADMLAEAFPALGEPEGLEGEDEGDEDEGDDEAPEDEEPAEDGDGGDGDRR